MCTTFVLINLLHILHATCHMQSTQNGIFVLQAAVIPGKLPQWGNDATVNPDCANTVSVELPLNFSSTWPYIPLS